MCVNIVVTTDRDVGRSTGSICHFISYHSVLSIGIFFFLKQRCNHGLSAQLKLHCLRNAVLFIIPLLPLYLSMKAVLKF